MGSKTPEDHYRRLSEAVDLYLKHRAASDGGEAQEGWLSGDELLEQNPELSDLLAPMLQTEPADGITSTAESPRFFGDYELLREVGRGGMGIVYEAMEVALQRRVALKILPDRPGTSASRIERFRREAAAAGRLQHPGIAAVHRVGEHGDTHFIAMELVDGPNLAVVLERLSRESADGMPGARTQSLDLGEEAILGAGGYYASVAELVARVAEALAYAHDHGVVHRDVKPHNILLGGRSGVKLVDFGLAKDFDREAVTRTGDTAGTPDYMSPEQVRGEPVDLRSDVFSLGVVLYELLTWKRPFAAGAVHSTLAAIVDREPMAIRRLQPQTPRDLVTICHKALEKDPAKRYPSAAALAEDLRRFRRHEPILATPPTAASRAVKLVRRNRAVSAAAVFALLALVVAPISFAIYFKQARDRLGVEQLETARQRDLAGSILVEARTALDDLYRWLAEERLAGTPGMSPVRQELMERALGFYERFCELAGDEPSLRMDTLLAKCRLGKVLYELRKIGRAQACLVEALEAMETLKAPVGRESELLFERARTNTVMISLTSNGSDVEAAKRHEEKALELLATLPESSDRNWRTKHHHLATVYALRSRRLQEYAGDPGGALAAINQAIAYWDGVVKRELATDKICAVLASALSSRALLMARQSKFDEALADCERGLELLQVPAASHSLGMSPSRESIRFLQQQCEVLLRSGQPERAIEAARKAVGLAERLHSRYPEYQSIEFLYASSVYDLSNALVQSDDEVGACEQLELVWRLASKLCEASPGRLAATALLGNVAGPLAVLRRKLHGAKPDETLPLHERAVQVFEAAHAKHPKSASVTIMLAMALSAFGNELCHADQLLRAKEVLARAVELNLRTMRARPRDKERRLHTLVAFVRQIATDRDLGQLDAAHAAAMRFVAELPDAQTHYEAAREMARLAASAASSSEHAGRSAEWRRQAIEWLGASLAEDASRWGRASADSAFADLVETDAFQRLDPGH